MILYFVANARQFVCGPFRDIETAKTAAEDYSNRFWGPCHVETVKREG